MEIEKEKVSKLVDKLSDRVDELSPNPSERDEFVKKVIDMVENDLSKEEKVILYNHIFDELSFKRMVEQPDFMIKQSNVRLRSIFFFGILVFVMIIITGILFSNTPLITNLHNYILSIFELANLD